MSDARLSYLFQAYFDKAATSSEEEELMELLRNDGQDQQVQQLMEAAWQGFQPEEKVFSPAEGAAMLRQVLLQGQNTEPAVVRPRPRRFMGWKRWTAAAIILLVVTGGYLWLHRAQGPGSASSGNAALFSNDIPAPRGNKTVLQLANGRQILLDSAHNGMLAMEGKTSVVKQTDGQIAYKGGGEKAVGYNTLTVPKGSRPTKLLLADGTSVWLNVASSIRYPVVFSGGQRVVEVTGEAYFEVAKNTAMPFKVMLASGAGAGKEMEVQVLGTRFNINAYTDEDDVRTTLFEGSVKVVRDRHNFLLRPGGQAILDSAGALHVVQDADLDEVLAWKNGRFQYNNADIRIILRQASRWYDVDISYEGAVTEKFSGGIPRNVNISQLFRILESTKKIKFKINGQKIIVTPA